MYPERSRARRRRQVLPRSEWLNEFHRRQTKEQTNRQTEGDCHRAKPSICEWDLNHLTATLKPQSNGYSNTVIGTLTVDEWAVTYGTARLGLGRAAAHSGPSSLYQM